MDSLEFDGDFQLQRSGGLESEVYFELLLDMAMVVNGAFIGLF